VYFVFGEPLIETVALLPALTVPGPVVDIVCVVCLDDAISLLEGVDSLEDVAEDNFEDVETADGFVDGIASLVLAEDNDPCEAIIFSDVFDEAIFAGVFGLSGETVAIK